ncbi:MAG: transposase [Phycisphaerales bacterium]|nr:transposase [Phycisphaerales bacterium]
MAQSLAQIFVHIIFSTKGRYPYLTPGVQPELHAYAATVLKTAGSPAVIINSVADHVHILCVLSKNSSAADLVQEVKTSSSKWIKTKGGNLKKFQWQAGYGIFSVSPSQVPAVRRYIADQEKHHRRMTFEDEFRRVLVKCGVEYDERYVFD